jgi:putative DNA primase/helicase
MAKVIDLETKNGFVDDIPGSRPKHHALSFAAKGFMVFPQDRNKVPCIKGWPDLATSDTEQIETWAKEFPKCNWAVVTGKQSMILVFDVDIIKGQPGKQSLERLRRDFQIPDTMTARTPSGGWHLYFLYPENGNGEIRNVSKIEGYPGIEVKADGGCVTLPGSFYTNGAEYVLLEKEDPAPLPEGLLKLLQSASFAKKKEIPAEGETIPEGSRNTFLASLAGKMRYAGMDSKAVLQALLVENEKRCDPPLPESEIREVAESICRYEAGTAKNFHRTDMGNAERLAARFGAYIRYCDEWRRWLIWDERHWAKDNTRTIRRFAKNTIRGLYIEASQIEDEKQRKSLVRYALSCESLSSIRAMIEAATSEPDIPVTADQLDRNTMLLNVENGTLNLEAMELQPHRQEDLITKLAPVVYDDAA